MDFVEFPLTTSMPLYPEVLRNYELHYDSKSVIPQELLDKLKSETFNVDMMLLSLWHRLLSV
jgi:peptidyl-dipeptidase Dcp